MLEAAAPYLVAIFAMLISGGSALTLIYIVSHFDPESQSRRGNPAVSP
jgi:hypothetical protein